MTVRHIAAGAELTRPLTDLEFQTLNRIGLLSPCHRCTALLNDGNEGEDEVVYHPDLSGGRRPDLIVAEVEAALNPRKH